ncbi:MAG: SemiSWEET family transporter [Ferruginibacter sp.]
MNWMEVIGLVASALSSITFMPQVYRAWNTKSVGDLSLAMMFIVFLSTILWLIYGIGIHSLPVIICNSAICFLSMILIYFKFTFPSNKKPLRY